VTRRLRVGISPCPNDTFAFHGLMAGAVEVEADVALDVELADVEELNRRVLAGELDIAKTSFHAALAAAGEVRVLPAGSALGRGVGPLLLSAELGAAPGPSARVLCPGRWTTATLLWELFHAGHGVVEQRVFSEIMPALVARRADFGVCIHEGRFTWERHGLGRVEDLGETWERATGAPLPLGGIVARRSVDDATARAVSDAIRRSIEWGRAHRGSALAAMRSHAQELSDDVLWAHVDLYVGEHTLELGDEGRRALDTLSELARQRGLLPRTASRLEVLA
jgi:1,4-dihydroxy-6-naphthoate synthase